ncbi:MAG: hypothetical protein ISS25_04080 [Nanoarchaeota archaeon]|nr:hypothetical protein [DPANN group archaeon]MBL7116979.1 hypothetical protein [Nanoarchaeota archaeon]
MEIKIDTKKDSVEDIKKTIDFLLKFVEVGERGTNDIPTVGEGAFNMFGDSSKDSDKKDDDDSSGVTIVEY